MEKTITALPNQSIADIVHMAYGTLEALMPFCRANNVSVTDVPAVGTVFTVPGAVDDVSVPVDEEALSYLYQKNVRIGTAHIGPLPPAPPVVPVTAGLVGEYFASFGLLTSGTNVTGWQDLSGNDNHLEVTGTNPIFIDNAIGTERAVLFDTDPAHHLITTNLFNGIDGHNAVTVFTVADLLSPPASLNFIGYYDSFWATETDSFVGVTQKPAGTVEIGGLLRGNVGLSSAILPAAGSASFVYSVIFNKGTGGGSEINAYKNNSNAGLSLFSINDNTNAFGNHKLTIGEAPIKMGCMLIYNRVLTPTEMLTMNDFLRGKYSI